mgnify:CR=1 FL=1
MLLRLGHSRHLLLLLDVQLLLVVVRCSSVLLLSYVLRLRGCRQLRPLQQGVGRVPLSPHRHLRPQPTRAGQRR